MIPPAFISGSANVSAQVHQNVNIHYLRSDLNPSRTSSVKSFGCSQACKVPALVELIEMDQFGIRLLGPAPRRLVELVREHAYGRRDVDALDGNVTVRVLPVETTGGDARVRQPEVGAVVEDVISRVRPSGTPSKDRAISSRLRGSWSSSQAARPTGESAMAYSVWGRDAM